MQVRRSATGSLPKGWRAARLARAGSCSHTPRSSFEMPLGEVVGGVAFALRVSFEIRAGLGVAIAETRATGGGAKSALGRKMLADILGCRIARTPADEGPAYGAALLAGVAAGMYPDVERACDRIGVRPDANEPDPATASIYDDYYSSYRDLYPATVSAMHKLSGLASRARPLI